MDVISTGWGMQSSALYFMSSIGVIPRADVAVFADTGAEHPKTLEYVEFAIDWAKRNDGIPIHVIRNRNILDDIRRSRDGSRIASLPTFTANGGMVMRQCTGEYKIDQVMQGIRKIYGLKKGQRMKPTNIWIGISTDEASRMKVATGHNLTNKYPLIDEMMSRGDCKKWLSDNNFPTPIKSSCVFCPYHSNDTWQALKTNEPELFDIAIEVDEIIRKPIGNMNEERFLHRSLKPIGEAYFGEDQINLFENECEGYCGL